MARKSKRLFTIGYEQTPAKAVLDELEAAFDRLFCGTMRYAVCGGNAMWKLIGRYRSLAPAT